MNQKQRQFLSEVLGTFLLVFIGCGTAMTVGSAYVLSTGYVITALAFGAAMTLAVYLFGDISGCHINPAVSLAMYMDKRIEKKDLGLYIIGQCIGAGLASSILASIFSCAKLVDQTGCLASNGLGGVGGNEYIGLIVETLLTAIFVLVVLKVTDKNSKTGSLTGIVIGTALLAVHLLGIGLTGTSVNPARSLGPAFTCLVDGTTSEPMAHLAVFIFGPILGAIIAYYLYVALYGPRKNVRKTPANASDEKQSPKHASKESFAEYFEANPDAPDLREDKPRHMKESFEKKSEHCQEAESEFHPEERLESCLEVSSEESLEVSKTTNPEAKPEQNFEGDKKLPRVL